MRVRLRHHADRAEGGFAFTDLSGDVLQKVGYVKTSPLRFDHDAGVEDYSQDGGFHGLLRSVRVCYRRRFRVKMEIMVKHYGKPAGQKNGHATNAPITPLGKELRKLREKYVASGGKLLNRRELAREVAERRGSRS